MFFIFILICFETLFSIFNFFSFEFLQDVSDRVEKIDFQSDPLKTLEKNSKYITRDDWNLHLDETITSDLRKYRAYQGNSVRDLLRALRNKVNFDGFAKKIVCVNSEVFFLNRNIIIMNSQLRHNYD